MRTTPDEKIKAFMETIQAAHGGKAAPTFYSSLQAQENVAARKLRKALKALPGRKRALCDQNHWVDFVEWYNTILFGHSVSLETMRCVIRAMTDPRCLTKVACIRTSEDAVCAYAIELLEDQASLQAVFESYNSRTPFAYFRWHNRANSTPEFRGGSCLFALLGKIDAEHFLAALRNRGSAPVWMHEEELLRYSSSCFSAGKQLLHTHDITTRYKTKLDLLAKSGIIDQEELSRYL